MGLGVWLPGRLKVGIRRLRVGLVGLRRDLDAPLRPVAQERELRAAPRADAGLRRLEVLEVIPETDQAVTLVLANDPSDPIAFTPGQFLTLVLTLRGREVRRPYSLCSDPADASRLAVTVKRVAGGLVSNHLNDAVRPGDRLAVFGAGGRFGVAPEAQPAPARLILVGGGSGVTPLMSVARAFCARSPQTPMDFIYANRDRASVIFARALDELAAAHPALRLHHVLEEGHEGFEGTVGRLDQTTAAGVVPVDPEARYLICGPAPMMEAVEGHLRGAGVEPTRIMVERFTPPTPGAPTPGAGAVYPVRLTRSGRTLQVTDDQTLLEAARAAGVPLEFSCAVGGCGACRVRLVSGQVEMETPNCLTTAEEADGHCLACVARPRGPLIVDA